MNELPQSDWPLVTGALRGHLVTLEPMSIDHVGDIESASGGSRSTFRYTGVPAGADGAKRYVSELLAAAADGLVAPFVQRRNADRRVVGCTRFMDPRWPLGRAEPDEIEIGGTWLSEDAQRSGVNTEAKLLLLTHAFDRWAVQRVAICTDERNDQSRRAIERIGATFEGVLRHHRPSYLVGETDLRNTAVYSIVRGEWPGIKSRLEALLH